MEPLEVINKRLLEHYGRFEDGRPNWRVIWSDDELEKRLITHTPEGLELLTPEIREVPKYSYAQHRFILERLLPVLYNDQLTTKTSYEPVWTFEDSRGNALPPVWEAIYLLIQTVQENLNNAGKGAVKYKTPEGMGNTAEEVKARVEKLEEQLFGNENPITDALSLDSAVGYGPRQRNDWLH